MRRNICSHEKKNLLFLSRNMAAVQNLYSQGTPPTRFHWSSQQHERHNFTSHRSPHLRSLDIPRLALPHEFTVLLYYLNLEQNSRQITANQIGPGDQNASDWFRTK